jgi:hypothetical protein
VKIVAAFGLKTASTKRYVDVIRPSPVSCGRRWSPRTQPTKASIRTLGLEFVTDSALDFARGRWSRVSKHPTCLSWCNSSLIPPRPLGLRRLGASGSWSEFAGGRRQAWRTRALQSVSLVLPVVATCDEPSFDFAYDLFRKRPPVAPGQASGSRPRKGERPLSSGRRRPCLRELIELSQPQRPKSDTQGQRLCRRNGTCRVALSVTHAFAGATRTDSAVVPKTSDDDARLIAVGFDVPSIHAVSAIDRVRALGQCDCGKKIAARYLQDFA